MKKIGKSRNAKTFRWLASQVQVGQVQSSTNRADDHNGITPAFIKKLEAAGLIQVVSKVRGETSWRLLAEVPSE